MQHLGDCGRALLPQDEHDRRSHDSHDEQEHARGKRHWRPEQREQPEHDASHTGMIAVRLNTIEKVVTPLFSLGLWTTRSEGGRGHPHWVPYAATSTLICLGLASSRSGSRTVSTPALYSALTLPASTVGGSANVRANEP